MLKVTKTARQLPYVVLCCIVVLGYLPACNSQTKSNASLYRYDPVALGFDRATPIQFSSLPANCVANLNKGSRISDSEISAFNAWLERNNAALKLYERLRLAHPVLSNSANKQADLLGETLTEKPDHHYYISCADDGKYDDIQFVRLKISLRNHKFSEAKHLTEYFFRNSAVLTKPRVAADFVQTTSNYSKRGLASITECLGWKSFPVAMINKFVPLINSIENRQAAANCIRGEFATFGSSRFSKISGKQTLGMPGEEFNFEELNLSDEGNSALQTFAEHNKIDYQYLKSLIESLLAEAENEILIPSSKRKFAKYKQLSLELASILSYLSKDKVGNADAIKFFRSKECPAKFVEKILAKQYVDGVACKKIIQTNDVLMLKMEAERLIINLNLFERKFKRLPDSIAELISGENTAQANLSSWNDDWTLDYSKAKRSLEWKRKATNEVMLEKLLLNIPAPTLD